ncbi:hypothetical protein [Burkholderia sp. Bp8998]|uniref:hypothetical protein n=1 Tax=Burkholderia sp. Bp8998 TaxID=2184557 RepID=UPI000F5A4A7B|nr:hypothetical protein [Burkholderia sp. Bp8998]
MASYTIRTGSLRCTLIEKDDGRFAADRYRALTRREIDAHGASSGCMPIDLARLRVAVLRGTPATVSVATAVVTSCHRLGQRPVNDSEK